MGGKKMFFGNQNMNVDLTGLLSYYKFIDNVEDSMGNNPLETASVFQYSEGVIDKAIRRGDSSPNGKLRGVDSSILTFMNDASDQIFTVNFFYNPLNYGFGTALRKTLISRYNQIEIGYEAPGANNPFVKPYVRLYSDLENYLHITCVNHIYNISKTWNNLSFTYDGSKLGNGIKIYLNGEKQTTVDQSVGIYSGMFLQDVKTHFISSQYSTQNLTLINVDEIQVWDRVLSPLEILRIYKNQTKGKPLI